MSLLIDNDFQHTDGMFSTLKKKLKAITKNSKNIKKEIKKTLKTGKISKGGKKLIEKILKADVPDVQLVY